MTREEMQRAFDMAIIKCGDTPEEHVANAKAELEELYAKLKGDEEEGS